MTAGFWRRGAGAPPRLVGHRGVRAPGATDEAGDRPDPRWPPENTLASFARAVAEGATAIEFDVRPCATGEVVVHHDETLVRSTAGADPRPVAAVPWAELARLELPGGHRVPTLGEALAFAREVGVAVNVELKRDVPDRPASVRAVAAALRSDPPQVPLLVSSFDPPMLLALRALAPRVDRALLVHRAGRRPLVRWLAAPLAVTALHLDDGLVGMGTIARLRARGYVVNVWTVNVPERAAWLSRQGVDGIITDAPGRLGAYLAQST